MPVPFLFELLDVGGEEEALPFVVAVLWSAIAAVELRGWDLAILRELRQPVFTHAQFLRGVFQCHEAHADFNGAHQPSNSLMKSAIAAAAAAALVRADSGSFGFLPRVSVSPSISN